MEHKLRRTDRRLACQGAVLEFYRDSMILPDGAEQTWDYVHHKKGGGACSVPVLPGGQGFFRRLQNRHRCWKCEEKFVQPTLICSKI